MREPILTHSEVHDYNVIYSWSRGLQPTRAPGSCHLTATLNNVKHTFLFIAHLSVQ